jgi:hypothetical protein
MKIELKNIKHFKSMSEETNACQADVWADGVKVGSLKNSGRGEGMYPCVSADVQQKMNEWAAKQPKCKTKYGEFDFTLDHFFAMLIENDLVMKEAQRYFKTRVCLVNEQGKLLTTKTMPAELIAQYLSGAKVMKVRPGERVLKTVEEVAQALAH